MEVRGQVAGRGEEIGSYKIPRLTSKVLFESPFSYFNPMFRMKNSVVSWL